MERTIRFYEAKKEYGELSNFYHHRKGSEIIYNKKKYRSSEHLYQALKYDYKGASAESLEYAELIRNSSTAYKAKLIANQMICNRFAWQKELNIIIQKYLELGLDIREDWDDVIDDTMLEVLRLKFTQDLHCQRVLLATGDALLVEFTTRDDYWASGANGKGLNMLGLLLCKVREEIRLQLALTPLKGDINEGEGSDVAKKKGAKKENKRNKANRSKEKEREVEEGEKGEKGEEGGSKVIVKRKYKNSEDETSVVVRKKQKTFE